jgi:hypothetical protein
MSAEASPGELIITGGLGQFRPAGFRSRECL